LYEAFGNIALLPWIGLSYALANFSMASLARKIIYCFDLRWTLIVNLAIVMIGAIIAGSAHSMEAVIVGRIVMGISATIVLQM
jgi:predicted MFS family arabinose efflux permease